MNLTRDGAKGMIASTQDCFGEKRIEKLLKARKFSIRSTTMVVTGHFALGVNLQR